MLCFRNFFWRKSLWIRGEEEGISKFCVKFILSHSAGKFRTRTLCCFVFSGFRNFFSFRGFCRDFLSKLFCPHVPKNFVEEHFCAAFQKYSASEKVYGSEERMEGVSRFSVEFLFVSQCRKFPSRKFLVFHYFRASKKFG